MLVPDDKINTFASAGLNNRNCLYAEGRDSIFVAVPDKDDKIYSVYKFPDKE